MTPRADGGEIKSKTRARRRTNEEPTNERNANERIERRGARRERAERSVVHNTREYRITVAASVNLVYISSLRIASRCSA